MADKTYIFVGAGNPAGSGSAGFWRKELGDDHWEAIAENGLCPSPEAREIVVHPQNADKVYIGTQRGLYLSKDGGSHWQRAELPEGRTVFPIRFHPNNPDVMFLGTEGNEVYRSDDGGETWNYLSTIINPDAIQMGFPPRILGMALEPNNPDAMYAALEVGGAARSLDGGKNWEIINKNLAPLVDLLDSHAISVGGAASDNVFVSNRTGIWRSRDRGSNWENTHVEKFSGHHYSRCNVVAPNDPNTIYAGIGLNFGAQQGGVMRSQDLGDTWERFDHGVETTATTFHVEANPKHPEQVFFCTLSGQVIGTEDGGATWKQHDLPEGAKTTMGLAIVSA